MKRALKVLLVLFAIVALGKFVSPDDEVEYADA